MAYDHEEQEQLDELRAWWKEYGNLVLLGVAAVALVIAGFQGWRQYQHGRSVAAATLYQQLEQAESTGDHKKVLDIAGRIVGGYGSTPYGTFAALSSARASFETGDMAAAKTQLTWVMSNAREDEIRDIARLRLAGVLLDEKKYDEAIKQLDTKPVEALASLYSDLKGDVLTAQGKKVEARNAYQFALDRSEPASPYRSIVQLKLDALGDAGKQ
jgi:predicted negative regulator of RcsB-dependent stress response